MSDNSMILAIETSTKNCSVALGKSGMLIVEKEQGGDYSHAENLAVFVNEILEENGYNLQAIDAIAVGKGPGSYTGLRIGVSYAKGLCLALRIPLIGVNSLTSLAYGAFKEIPKEALAAPMIDARRMEVYCAIYDKDLNVIKKVSADIIDKDSYNELLSKHQIYFLGNGSDKCKATLIHPNAFFLDEKDTSAKFLLTLAEDKYQKKDFEDIAYFEPFYLKEFVAAKPSRML
ncbi:MAG: tRNA (adenosine(37)-N6)-threonylcarbamoyltransferase complex dimerization subunit type 1 TsaB [Verrucomicrobia bacterium]|nr:tRNA (adenosine(37)-N6)-threonylcarbamoyltransferase complex dimerization subunit type 1 TsaB [Verrucomicrobiota bacterium]|tara:strand:+ start:662 stop:1354 length:693 start_codon:yes stop_codon:yes gene_type:complete